MAKIKKKNNINKKKKNNNNSSRKQNISGVISKYKASIKRFAMLFGLLFGLIFALGACTYGVDETLFKTGSSSSKVVNSGKTVYDDQTGQMVYVDEQTGEKIPAIGINIDGTMWIIPTKTVEYIREKISQNINIEDLNLTEDISAVRNMESEETREKLNKYIREFIIAEQAAYYPNLEY